MLNKIKSRLCSSRIIIIFILLMFLLSCAKKQPTIAWEKNTSFAEILDSAGENYVMLDFVRNG